MAPFNNRMIFKVEGSSVECQQLELNAGESGLLAAVDRDVRCFCGCMCEGVQTDFCREGWEPGATWPWD